MLENKAELADLPAIPQPASGRKRMMPLTRFGPKASHDRRWLCRNSAHLDVQRQEPTPMHAFVTRHKVIVIAILLLSTFAFLGLYARGRLATDGARAATPSSHV